MLLDLAKPKAPDILFCGDLHGQFEAIRNIVRYRKPDALVLLGDMEAPDLIENLIPDVDIYWIFGNHDMEKQAGLDAFSKSKFAKNNLHGRVIDIKGVKIAGLGGEFSSAIWKPPEEPKYNNLDEWVAANQFTDKFFAKHKMMHQNASIFYDDYVNLMLQQADILVAHGAPSCHPYGYEAIDELALELGASKVFHGDHHDSLDYTSDTDKMGFETIGVGLRGVTSITGEIVLEGELDKSRFDSRMKKKSESDNMKIRPSRAP